METILLKFDGYWLESYLDEMPHDAGVYCVYACEPMAANKIVVLRELVYVGSADDVVACLKNHSSVDDWKMRLRDGEMLCFSFAPVDDEARELVRSALVSYHTPPCNQIAIEPPPRKDAKITIEGEHVFLDDSLMVKAG